VVSNSVFAKLLAIMVTMAACLLLLVTLFFWLVVAPLVNPTIHRITQPEVAGHSATHSPSSVTRETIASPPNGIHTAHAAALVVLLLIMVGVVLSAHAVLKRLLQPLRVLTVSPASVRDIWTSSYDGVGIPGNDVGRLFEPFYRVDRSRSKSTGGYGLGLSICKRVMEAHGGSIGIERQVVRGTSFVLTFPKTAFAKSA
jgi:hypothetical protein